MCRYKYLGDFSATPPQYSRYMECRDCRVSWSGCWDNFQCPECGEGELPSSDVNVLLNSEFLTKSEDRGNI